jgi:hypothetical protein
MLVNFDLDPGKLTDTAVFDNVSEVLHVAGFITSAVTDGAVNLTV